MVPNIIESKHLPKGWELKPLSFLFQERRETSSDLETYPLCSLTIEDGLIEKPERYNREFLLKNRQDNQYKIVYPGDFVYNPMNLRWGAIALSKFSKPVTISAYYNVLIPNSTIIPSNLLLDILKSRQMLNVYENVGKGTLVEKKRVHLNIFLKLKILIPTFTESKRIAEILSSVDEATASTQAVIDQTRKVKQGLLQQLLTRGIGHTRFKESAIGKIPDGWTCVQLSKVCSKITDGVHHKPNYISHGIPFITVKNLTYDSGINFNDVNFISEEDHKEFIKRTHPEKGDVLLSKDGTLGIPRVIDTDIKFSIFVSVALLKPIRELLNSYFLHYALESPVVSSQLLLNQAGSALKHIHLVDLRSSWIPLPSMNEQLAIVERICAIDNSINNSLNQLSSLNKLKNGLMQDLLTGRVRVGVTP